MSETSGFSGSGGGGNGVASQEIIEVLRKPQSWLRLGSLIFAIIVFASIADQCLITNPGSRTECAFNVKMSACNYGIAIGVIAFLGALFFLAIDFASLYFSKPSLDRVFVTLDFSFSALWAFMWFVGFCFLTNEWRVAEIHFPSSVANAARGAIAFSFFSIVSWTALAVLGFLTFRRSNTGYVGGSSGGGGVSGGMGGGGGSSALAGDAPPYQEPPSDRDAEKPVY